MSGMDPAESLADDIGQHILSHDAENFEPLALRLFAYQYAHNQPYRMFCEGRKATPDSVTRWEEIPPAPAAAFKRFALTCVSPELCTPEHGGRTFHSSGTTGSETSKHYMDAHALRLYEWSAEESYSHFVDADGYAGSLLALMPEAGDAPHSSLSYMLAVFTNGYGGKNLWGEGWTERFAGGWSERFARAYAQDRRDDEWDETVPNVLFGTAFAWVQLLDYLAEQRIRFRLPAGTRIIETGGFKGRSREVERDELYRLFTDRLGVPATHCLAEYGMSEMASQFYDSTLRDHVTGVVREPRKVSLPHLLRTRVIDPVTGQEAERGQPGVLAHYDLANLNSCLAIQTEDWGYAHPDGDGFVLLGRAPGAALRGCSLTAEEFAARQSGR